MSEKVPNMALKEVHSRFSSPGLDFLAVCFGLWPSTLNTSKKSQVLLVWTSWLYVLDSEQVPKQVPGLNLSVSEQSWVLPESPFGCYHGLQKWTAYSCGVLCGLLGSVFIYMIPSGYMCSQINIFRSYMGHKHAGHKIYIVKKTKGGIACTVTIPILSVLVHSSS